MLTFLLVVVIVLVIVAAVAAVVIVAGLQKQSLQKKLRLEVVNQGNVRSRYELRAEDVQQALEFLLTLDGDPLPPSELVEAPVTPEAKQVEKKAGAWILPPDSAKAGKTAGAALKTSGEAANTLGSLGMLLPRSLRAPLLQVAGSLRRGQGAADRAKRLSGQARKLQGPGKGKAPSLSPAADASGVVTQVWVQTPFVQPGASLALELQVSTLRAGKTPTYPFRVLSRTAEVESAPAVVQEGSVEIKYRSPLRRALPYVLIFVVTVGILAFALWLASTGVLS